MESSWSCSLSPCRDTDPACRRRKAFMACTYSEKGTPVQAPAPAVYAASSSGKRRRHTAVSLVSVQALSSKLPFVMTPLSRRREKIPRAMPGQSPEKVPALLDRTRPPNTSVVTSSLIVLLSFI